MSCFIYNHPLILPYVSFIYLTIFSIHCGKQALLSGAVFVVTFDFEVLLNIIETNIFYSVIVFKFNQNSFFLCITLFLPSKYRNKAKMPLSLILIAFKKLISLVFCHLNKCKVYSSINSVFCVNLYLFAFSEAFIFLLPFAPCLNNAYSLDKTEYTFRVAE